MYTLAYFGTNIQVNTDVQICPSYTLLYKRQWLYKLVWERGLCSLNADLLGSRFELNVCNNDISYFNEQIGGPTSSFGQRQMFVQ